MSSLVLMALYALIAFALQGATIGIIYMLEGVLGGWSGPIFLFAYFTMFWAAWPIALRLTEPKAEAAAQPAAPASA